LDQAATSLVGFERDRVRAQAEEERTEVARLEQEATSLEGAGAGLIRSPLGDAATSAESEIAALFDPVTRVALEAMFPASGKWAGWCERAKRNGLLAARPVRGRFNPYIAGLWFLEQGIPGWDQAKLMRVLHSRLPARSLDKRALLLLASRE
jgi:hypothetical protein